MAEICQNCSRKLGLFESFGNPETETCKYCVAAAAAAPAGRSASSAPPSAPKPAARSSVPAPSIRASSNGSSSGSSTEIAPGEVTAQRLKSIFDAAFMDCKIDGDGDVYVKSDACGAYLYVNGAESLLRIESLFAFESHASHNAKLELCNRINDGVRMTRAYVRANGKLGLDYYFPLEGGVDERLLVLTFKRFTKAVVEGLRAFDSDGIVA